MSALKDALKNEYTKQILRATGVRKVGLQQRKTPHYRMPILEEAGGWMRLNKYQGPEIPASEWEDLTYTTYASDPTTFFAPITSATGEIELKGFWEYGKADLDGVWTENAKKCPSVVNWVESIGARLGRVQLLRMTANTMRECRWGLHLDNNNQGNPTTRAGSYACGSSSPTIPRARWLSARPSSTAGARSRSPCRGISRPSSTPSSCGTAGITPRTTCATP